MSAPVATWTEIECQLKKSQSVVLDANGNGTLSYDPDNARQRWEVTEIVLDTNQAANTAPYPNVSVYVNSAQSFGNLEGQSWTGNQDTLTGLTHVGSCDVLNIVFSGGIAGSVATAVVTGSKFTRRA